MPHAKPLVKWGFGATGSTPVRAQITAASALLQAIPVPRWPEPLSIVASVPARILAYIQERDLEECRDTGLLKRSEPARHTIPPGSGSPALLSVPLACTSLR